jgi:hypothetical protein
MKGMETVLIWAMKTEKEKIEKRILLDNKSDFERIRTNESKMPKDDDDDEIIKQARKTNTINIIDSFVINVKRHMQ